ncbi:coiled-coil domain-containing protein 55-domain containing protein, partial [Trichophaea hybrida]
TSEFTDSSVYEYDSVLEDLRSVDMLKKKMKEIEAIERRPKYMERLLASADMRKQDQLRAQEKLVRKEREEEGDQFKDKECFVTGAYMKQQEILRMSEMKEKMHEGIYPPPSGASIVLISPTPENQYKPQGMFNFHRNMLNQMDDTQELLVTAAQSKCKVTGVVQELYGEVDSMDGGNAEREALCHLDAKGTIQTNEEGHILDKSELLSGGLNIVVNTKSSTISHATVGVNNPRPAIHRRGVARQNAKESQSKELQNQFGQSPRQVQEQKRKLNLEFESQLKSRKTESNVMMAKERYLARKAAAATAK